MPSIEILKAIGKRWTAYEMEKEVISWLIENLSEEDVGGEAILALIREMSLMGFEIAKVSWFEYQETIDPIYYAHVDDMKEMIECRSICGSFISRMVFYMVNRTGMVKFLPGFRSYYACQCFEVAAENLYSFVKVYG